MQTKQEGESISFREELEGLINKHSYERYSDTPDFILANYIMNCLDTFTVITKQREKWYGRGLKARDNEVNSNMDILQSAK